ncbi:MAG: hypothetical protein ACREA1_02685 [Nitrosotalea sp.]
MCGYEYCNNHLLPQRHKCTMLENVEYVKADSFQSVSESTPLDEPKKTLVDANVVAELNIEKVNVITTPSVEDTYWLSDCLKDAQNVIAEYHDEKPDDKNFEDCIKFFSSKTFGVKMQNNGNASGDINLIKDLPSQPSYKIYVHDIFKDDTRDNRRMVTIILIHQLLHAIHPSRMHDSANTKKGINRLQHEIANRASYHDALLNLESLRQSGKINLCNV